MADTTTPVKMDWYGSPGSTHEFQGATMEDAIAVANKFMKNPKDPSLVGQWRAVTPAAQDEGPDFIGKLKQALTGNAAPPMGDMREPANQAQSALSAVSGLLPNNNAEAAVMGASALAGPLVGAAGKLPLIGKALSAPGALGAVGRSAARVGLTTGAGVGDAAIEGGNVGEGAALGATAGLMGEAPVALGGMIQKFVDKFGRMETGAFKQRVANVQGPKLGAAVADDIPMLRGGPMRFNSVEDLIRLPTEGRGRAILGAQFDTVENEIIAKLKGAPSLKIPREAAEQAGIDVGGLKNLGNVRGMKASQALPQPGSSVVGVTAEEAIKIAKTLRGQSRKAGEGIQGRPTRELIDEVQGAIDNELRAQAITPRDMGLVDRYAGLRENYGKYKDLADAMMSEGITKLFPAQTKGGATIDLKSFHDMLMNNIDTLSPERFPNLHAMFTGSAPIGTGPVQKTGLPIVGKLGESLPIPGAGRIYGHPSQTKMMQLPETMNTPSTIGKMTRTIGRALTTATVPSAMPVLSEQLADMIYKQTH